MRDLIGPWGPMIGAVALAGASPLGVVVTEAELAPHETQEQKADERSRSLKSASEAHSRGLAALEAGDLESAASLLRRALDIRVELSPRSRELATSVSGLAETLESAGDLSTAEELYGQALAIEEQLAPHSLEVAESLNDLGIIVHDRGDVTKAERLFRRALALEEELAPDSLMLAATLNNLGVVTSVRNELVEAEAFHRRALAIEERLAPGSLDVAMSLGNLGTIAHERGDLAKAEVYYNRALAIEETLAPGSLDVAATLVNLGVVATDRSQFVEAEALLRRGLAIEEELSPNSLVLAQGLGNLGNLAKRRGDLATAEALYRRTLAIQEGIAPESVDLVASLANLGVIAQIRGDLATAEELYRRCLVADESRAPGSRAVAVSLSNLGHIAQTRGDLAAAMDLYQRSLVIREKLAPASLDTAASLNDLGVVALTRGDLTAAEDSFRRSLALRDRMAPAGLDVALSLASLGAVAQARGDLAGAETFVGQSLEIREKLAPESLAVAGGLGRLGRIALARWDLTAAERLYRRSVAITESLAPGSIDAARSRHALGLILALRGKLVAAHEELCLAVDELEAQVGRLGGSQARQSEFLASLAYIYRDCESALLELGERKEAFHILERSRARSLLRMLAERDLVFRDLPEELDREQRQLAAEYDRVQTALSRLSSQNERERAEELLGRLSRLRERQAELREEVRKASPRLASLQYPRPLDSAGVAGALDPGTVLLAYSVGGDTTNLYVVRGDALPRLTVLPITVSEESLRLKVSAFRGSLSRGDGAGRGVVVGGAPTSDGKALGRELYELLLRPAESLVGESERVLLSPDGPLHTLPFGALVRGDAVGRPQYFVEWKPFHVVVSGTVYAELKKDRKDPGPFRLVAFGDPRYDEVERGGPERLADPEVRSAVTRGAALTPLPFTREEVQAISGLFPERSRIYLEGEATEERAKSVGADASVLHFATHGLIDERFPLNSALALTIPEDPKEGEDNGLLQAWEIFESVRLDADLVVLSACGTGLGKEVGGEGLVGLTRAFQYAGARTVLASLWSVADRSTSELMKAFYTNLKEGKTKDEALRQAQLRLLKDSATAHPFHWAAFQVIGDWK